MLDQVDRVGTPSLPRQLAEAEVRLRTAAYRLRAFDPPAWRELLADVHDLQHQCREAGFLVERN